MVYVLIAAAVFLLDVGIKAHIDKKYARKVCHPHCKNKIILEKYYNKGAAFNFLAKKPELIKIIHTVMMVIVAVFYYFLLKMPGKKIGKLGMSFLAGGGLSNLLDRYQKGYVVDYLRFNIGPKRLRKIIFNVSDFFVFLGAVLTLVGSEAS
jgi:signal peptidase II